MEERKPVQSVQKFGWNEEHSMYVCSDLVDVTIRLYTANKYFDTYLYQDEQAQLDHINCEPRYLSNGIVHYFNRAWINESKSINVVISRVQLTRDMEEIVKCGEGIRTIVFPKSVQRMGKEACNCVGSLTSVVINDGLREFEGNYIERYDCHGDAYHEYYSKFYKSAVQKVRLPPGLDLGDGAFACLTSLKTVYLAEGLSKIGDECFSWCSITELAVPASVRRIGKSAFYNCKQLKMIEFAENSQLEEIGWCAFNECENIIIYVNPGMEFDLEAYVGMKVVRPPCLDTKIGGRTLVELRQLREVKLPEGLKFVGENWFAGCNIEKVVFPTSVREIQQNAFKFCNQLKSVEFDGDSALEKIELGAFFGSGLESFVCPQSLRSIADEAFSMCRKLKSVILNESLEVFGTNEYLNNGQPYNQVFESNMIRQIQLPSTLKRIRRDTFSSCRHLRLLDLPEGLETIGQGAFRESGIENFVAPLSLREIGKSAFCNCQELKSVKLNEGLEKVEDECFRDSGLERVEIPRSVRAIGDDAFRWCTQLREVLIPEDSGLERIGRNSFEGSWLEEVTIPSGVVEIPKRAFSQTDRLRKITFAGHSTLQRIDVGAFQGSGVESFVAPASLRYLGVAAFCDCKNLTHVELNENLRNVGWFGFFNTPVRDLKLPVKVAASEIDVGVGCDYKRTWTLEDWKKTERSQWWGRDIDVIIVPVRTKVIREQTFAYQNGLRRVVFQPNSQLERIEKGAFWYSGLEEIELPRSIKKIGDSAFRWCKSLRRVTFENDSRLEKIGQGAFWESKI